MANTVDIARALKDRNYFESLTEEQKAQVRKAQPAGAVELGDDKLGSSSELMVTGTGTGRVAEAPKGSTSAPGAAARPQHCTCNC